MDKNILEKILGRKQYDVEIAYVKNFILPYYKTSQIVITGGNGSLGSALADLFDANGVTGYHLLDINEEDATRRIHNCDITDYEQIAGWISSVKPNYIFHFAAAKHAPEGEIDPAETVKINVTGTENILYAIQKYCPQTRMVLSSTCKSCMPETCYGASKLIAERLTLNAGQSVARYFNVVQSSGNVFEIWDRDVMNLDPLLVTECDRYFISLDEAIALTVYAGYSKGRYIINPEILRHMPDVFDELYPPSMKRIVPPRRGDRIAEPLCANNETILQTYGHFYKVESTHD